MVKYPLLSLVQQRSLPELKQATPLPAMFEDSTHQLWHCDTVEGEMILKICNIRNVKTSFFWQGMALLFGINLPAQLADFKRVYSRITTHSPLTIPDYIASDRYDKNKKKCAFILTKMMPGKMVEAKDVDDAMVIALAKHIAQLHHQNHTTWGQLNHAEFDAELWRSRLQCSLQGLAKQHGDIDTQLLDEAMELAGKCQVENFVPIMLDLRWDQFLQQDGKLSTLVDLDAFVLAPRELELVLLEYLLTQSQAKIFMAEYSEYTDLSQVRKLYRLLLFLMNVLGEKNIDMWMKAPTRF